MVEAHRGLAHVPGRGDPVGRLDREGNSAFDGYKVSGAGRENLRMMLDHYYSQTKKPARRLQHQAPPPVLRTPMSCADGESSPA